MFLGGSGFRSWDGDVASVYRAALTLGWSASRVIARAHELGVNAPTEVEELPAGSDFIRAVLGHPARPTPEGTFAVPAFDLLRAAIEHGLPLPVARDELERRGIPLDDVARELVDSPPREWELQVASVHGDGNAPWEGDRVPLARLDLKAAALRRTGDEVVRALDSASAANASQTKTRHPNGRWRRPSPVWRPSRICWRCAREN
jgi:hypothetical protein